MSLGKRANNLFVDFQRSGDPALLDEVVRVAEQGVDAAGPDHLLCLSVLGSALMSRSAMRGTPADLVRATQALRTCLAIMPADDSQRLPVLADLAMALALRFELHRSTEALGEAEDVCRQALAAMSADRPRPELLSLLCAILTSQFSVDGRPERLDEAIEAGRVAVRLFPPGGFGRPGMQLRLALALQARLALGSRDASAAADRADRADRAELADRADRAELATIVEEATRDPGSEAAVADLSAIPALVCWNDFEKSSDPDDLDRFLDAVRRPLGILSPGHPQRPLLTMLAGTAYWQRFQRTGDEADVDAAVTALCEARAAMAPDDPRVVSVHANLGSALWAWYERTGRRSDLDDAVTSLRSVLDRPDLDATGRAGVLTNLGAARRSQFQATDDRRYLDESVRLLRRALSVTEISPTDRIKANINLGVALTVFVDRTGDLDAFEEGIEVLRHAAEDASPDSPELVSALANLGHALLKRFELFGEVGDIEDCMRALESALRLPVTDPVLWAAIAGSMGIAIVARYRRFDYPADIVAAPQYFQLAIDEASADDRGLRRYRFGLSMALCDRFDVTGDPADLDRAIEVARTAVEQVPPDDPLLPSHLEQLGSALRQRGEHAGDVRDLDEAVAVLRSACRQVTEEHPGHVSLNVALAFTLIDRRELHGGTPADVAEALGIFRAIATAKANSGFQRLMAARVWGEAATDRGDWRDGLAGYTTAVQVLPTAVWRGTTRRSRERLLHTIQGLARRAGECAMFAGDPGRAVELLEHGRAVLWSENLDLRDDFSELARTAPDLAARLSAVRSRLDRSRTGIEAMITSGA